MKHILIVEDEQDLRNTLQTKLVSDGYNVRTAANAEEALKHVLVQKPDLIILDIMTHSMHGATFLQRLNELPGDNTSKVIVLTNLDNDVTRQKMEHYKVEAYLVKANTSLETVAKKVNELLQV